MTAWIWSAVGVCAIAGGALWVDRSTQTDKLEGWIAQTAELEGRLESNPDQIIEPARELQVRIQSASDRWIGSTRRALEARVRALIQRAEKQTNPQ